MTDPRGSINVGEGTFDLRFAHHPNGQPFAWQGSEREKVVSSLNCCQFSEQRKVGTKASKGFDKAGQPLRRCIEDSIVALRIVKSVSERAIAVS